MEKIFSHIRQLYDWCISWADHPHGMKALCFFSFIESIFFPIPVDPLLIAMGVGQPKKSLYFATWATIFSVLGALGGYALGASFWDIMKGYVATEGSVFTLYFDMAQNMFKNNAMWAMILAGFTFLPFKVFTISAGIFGVGFVPFFIGCAMGRFARFFLIASLVYFWGPKVKELIEKHFEAATVLIGALVVLTILSYKLLQGF